jgi:hypothetical protein
LRLRALAAALLRLAFLADPFRLACLRFVARAALRLAIA